MFGGGPSVPQRYKSPPRQELRGVLENQMKEHDDRWRNRNNREFVTPKIGARTYLPSDPRFHEYEGRRSRVSMLPDDGGAVYQPEAAVPMMDHSPEGLRHSMDAAVGTEDAEQKSVSFAHHNTAIQANSAPASMHAPLGSLSSSSRKSNPFPDKNMENHRFHDVDTGNQVEGMRRSRELRDALESQIEDTKRRKAEEKERARQLSRELLGQAPLGAASHADRDPPPIIRRSSSLHQLPNSAQHSTSPNSMSSMPAPAHVHDVNQDPLVGQRGGAGGGAMADIPVTTSVDGGFFTEGSPSRKQLFNLEDREAEEAARQEQREREKENLKNELAQQIEETKRRKAEEAERERRIDAEMEAKARREAEQLAEEERIRRETEVENAQEVIRTNQELAMMPKKKPARRTMADAAVSGAGFASGDDPASAKKANKPESIETSPRGGQPNDGPSSRYSEMGVGSAGGDQGIIGVGEGGNPYYSEVHHFHNDNFGGPGPERSPSPDRYPVRESQEDVLETLKSIRDELITVRRSQNGLPLQQHSSPVHVTFNGLGAVSPGGLKPTRTVGTGISNAGTRPQSRETLLTTTPPPVRNSRFHSSVEERRQAATPTPRGSDAGQLPHSTQSVPGSHAAVGTHGGPSPIPIATYPGRPDGHRPMQPSFGFDFDKYGNGTDMATSILEKNQRRLGALRHAHHHDDILKAFLLQDSTAAMRSMVQGQATQQLH